MLFILFVSINVPLKICVYQKTIKLLRLKVILIQIHLDHTGFGLE